MKKFTTILGCFIATIGVMNAQSFSEVSPGTVMVQESSTPSVISSQRGINALTSYDDRVDFEADYPGVLINEDFSGGPGPGAITPCGPEISSAGDGCFGAGVLVDGFNVTADSGGDVIYIGVGAIGNTITLVGANTFADTTILTFEPDGAYAVGFDLFVSGVPNAELSVFDTSGGFLDIFNVTNTPDTQNFFGLISDIAIGKIEIKGEADAGELFGNLSFGNDALSVADNTLAGFNFYPNPTTGMINLQANKNIESVTLFSLLGQKVMSVNVGATTSDINLGALATGTYVMQVVVDGKTGSYKITKK